MGSLFYLNRVSGGCIVHGLVSAMNGLELVNLVSLVLRYHMLRPDSPRAPCTVTMSISWDINYFRYSGRGQVI